MASIPGNLQKRGREIIRDFLHHSRRDEHSETRVLVQHIEEVVTLSYDLAILRVDTQLSFNGLLLDSIHDIITSHGCILAQESLPRLGRLSRESLRKKPGQICNVHEAGGQAEGSQRIAHLYSIVREFAQ
jgi:hypothetical protein